jgi:hypothetical protein
MKIGAQARSNAWLKRHGTQVWKRDTAGWEACATMVCHGFAGFTMKYPG